MNPYQRIHRGSIVQPGHIDTAAKFAQLTAGVDLRGKRVLDVGCNLGEMCRLAKEAGAAAVRGVDCEPEYIYDARRVAPDDGIIYECRAADRITGNWDIIIASAMLHYVDIDKVLAQFARCGQMVLCDVWIYNHIPADEATMRFSDRGLLVPNYWAWASFQKRYFSECKSSGRSLSPDNSVRHLFRLSGPIKTPAKAVLLYGKSGTGKTSRGRDLVNGKGYEHLQLDSIFLDWHYEIESHIPMSVSDFVDSIWSGDSFYENTTPAWRQKIYLDYYRRYLDRWLGARQNLNVVIDGYDPIYPEFRAMLHAALNENGWLNITETECK